MSWQGGNGGGSNRQSKSALESKAPARQRKYSFGTHSESCHVWAQQNAETVIGQSGDGRIRFDGPTIYSYGNHFPIAHFTDCKVEGLRIVLFNNESRSVSTSQHQRHVAGALHGLDVLRVNVPDLKAWLDHSSKWDKKKHRALKREMWTASLEALASAKRMGQDDDGGTWRRDEVGKALAACRGLRDYLKITEALPANVVQWSADRAAKAEKNALNKRVAESLSFARNMRLHGTKAEEQISEEFRNVVAGRAYDAEHKIRVLRQRVTDIYSHRIVLSKTKRFPLLVKVLSAGAKSCIAVRDQWIAELRRAQRAESRDADLNALAELRRAQRAESRDADLNALAELRDNIAAQASGSTDDVREPRALWNYETTARLAAIAYAEGMAELGDYLRDNVSLKKWRQEVPATFKVETYGRQKITREEWLAGKGDASYHYYGGYGTSGAFNETWLRKRGECLETSRGASCPWSHAVKAFDFAQACRATGRAFVPNGHKIKVGTYAVDKIDADDTLHAGCHHLDFAEMQRLAIETIPERVRPAYPLPAVVS
jgi:hypothetical protein